jgi:hypothetical protein
MGQLDRNALNRAFWDLGLRFQWDEATWIALAQLPDLRAQLREYLGQAPAAPLAVYDVDFLSSLISSPSPLRAPQWAWKRTAPPSSPRFLK